MNLVNGSQLAKLLNVSPVAISKAARVGRITVHERDGKKLFDADTAAAELAANSQPGKKRDHKLGGRPPKDSSKQSAPAATAVASKPTVREVPEGESGEASLENPTTITQADLVEKIYKGKLARLKYEEAVGELVRIDEVAATVATEYSRVRARLLGIASKLAPDVALTDDESKCRALIEGAIVDALKELSADEAIQQKAAA